MHICEWGSGTISCSVDEKLRIDYAMYGRLTRSICAQHNTGHTNCRSVSSMTVVRNRCQGRRSCSLQATNGWFGDPCHGIFKYLEVRYTCITTGSALYFVSSGHTLLHCIWIQLHFVALYRIVLQYVASYCTVILQFSFMELNCIFIMI